MKMVKMSGTAFMVTFQMNCLVLSSSTTVTHILTFVFFAFITAKEQSQFAVNATIEDVKIKDISFDESMGDMETISEPLKENLSQNIAGKKNTEDIQTNDLLLAITPDGGCVGIKVKHGMPDGLVPENIQEWLKDAAKRAIDLKTQIETGACIVESIKERLEMKPNLSDTMIDKLVAQKRVG